MSPTLTLVLPMVALILALSLAAALWYWWSSGQPETPPDEEAKPEGGQSPTANFRSTLGKIGASVGPRLSGFLNSASAAIRSGSGASREISAYNAELIEVLRLYRDLSNGALVVQIEGQKYYALDEITDPQVRRRFLGNAEAMAQLARLKKGTSPLINWSDPALGQMPAPDTTSPARSAPVARSAESVSSSKKGKKEPAKPKSMADEIEQMLQYRLTLTPEYGHRSIHIRSSEDGSIFVEVDGQTFDGVGEVSDAGVRSFLQDIIRDWESGK